MFNKRELSEFGCLNDEIFSNLLDLYQMFDWELTWQEFLAKFFLKLSIDAQPWWNEKNEKPS